jgi:hypothetical protein
VLDERDGQTLVRGGEAEGVEGDGGGEVLLDEVKMSLSPDGLEDLDEVRMGRELGEESWFSDETGGDEGMMRMQRGVLDGSLLRRKTRGKGERR